MKPNRFTPITKSYWKLFRGDRHKPVPFSFFIPVFLILLIFYIPLSAQSHPGRELKRLRDSGRLSQTLSKNRINRALLENVIFLLTNEQRVIEGIEPLDWDKDLQKSARIYSENMADRQVLSHDSDTPGLETISARLKSSGIRLSNTTVGENLAVDFVKQISGIPFQVEIKHGRRIFINADTGRPIKNHTYLSFARETVQHWMSSPGHRKNLLSPDFQSLGVGLRTAIYKDFDAVYVTQHFQGELDSRESQ